MQYLSSPSYYLLISSSILGIVSVGLFILKHTRVSLISLLIASILVSLFFATADPFLHLWDEQFHALVSKNLMKHWCKPTLYEIPLLNYDYKAWWSNHVWLHKQPLFLWQMAVSQFFFGHTELGVRFPDILMHFALTFFIFDLGRLIKNETVGFLAALFFTFLNFPLDLISGSCELDHNDFAFMFYVTLSFWAYFKYRQRRKISWTFFIGLFVGCAILVKWLPGLLIYLGWAFAYVYENKTLKNILAKCTPIIVSLITTLAVFLPWQIYCYFNFPNEFKSEMHFNGMHFSEAVEGHEGDWTFHFTELNKLYGEGEIVPYILLISFLFFIYDKRQSITNKIIVLTSIFFVYLFFTIVKTKMVAFPVIVLPLIIVVLANFLSELMNLIKNKLLYKVVFFIGAITMAFLFLDLNLVLKAHTMGYKPEENRGRQVNINQMVIIKKLKDNIKDKKAVIFNCQEFNIKVMFYTDYVAYEFIPTENDCIEVKNKGYKIVVLKNNPLPSYIENDSSIVKLNIIK